MQVHKESNIHVEEMTKKLILRNIIFSDLRVNNNDFMQITQVM